MTTSVRRKAEQSNNGSNGLVVWRSPARPGIIFNRGTSFSHRYPRHWHDELHVCAYTSGSGNLAYGGQTHRIVPEDLVITPPGEVHENWVDAGASISFCSAYFDMSALRDFAEQFDARTVLPDFPSPVNRSGILRHAFFQMHRAAELRDSQLHCDEALLKFLAMLAAGAGRPSTPAPKGREHRATRRVREYISAYFSTSISLADVGSVAGLSPFHTQRVFRREAGMSPHEYQTQLRINCAKRMLRENHPLSEIAMAAGFADQSHLTRHFRRLVGLTPGRYAAVFSSRNRKIIQDDAAGFVREFPPAETFAFGG